MRNAIVVLLALALIPASGFGFQSEEWRRLADEARAAYVAKDLEKAEELYQAALSEAEKLGRNNIAVAQVLEGLIVVFNARKKTAESEKANLRAFTIKLEVFGEDSLEAAQAMTTLGTHYMGVPNAQTKAEAWYRRALAIQERLLPPEDPTRLTTMINLGRCLISQKRHEEGEQVLKQVLAIGDYGTAMTYLADSYLSQKRYAEAEALYLRCLERQVAGQDAKAVAIGLTNLANLYRDQGRFDYAETLYLKAIQALEDQYGPDNTFMLNTLQAYSVMLHEMRRDVEAALVRARLEKILAKKAP